MEREQINKILGQLVDHEKRLRVLENRKRQASKEKIKPALSSINFNVNSRAFFKEYGKNLPGPKKFVLVIAHLVKGKTGINVSSNAVKSCWDKHHGLLGGKLITGIYGTRAKESGWLDTTKNGSYHLTSCWKEIFQTT